MKILTALTLSVLSLLSACKTLEHIPAYDYLSGVDLRPYAEKGFLITPNTYGGDHTAIYLIDYIVMPEGNYTPPDTDNFAYPLRGTGGWEFKEGVSVQMALENIYDICIEMGADALVSFDVQPYQETYSNISNPVTVSGVNITGIAIKRMD